MINYLLLFSAIVIAIGGQLLLKAGVNQHELSISPKIIVDILTNKFLITGFLAYGLGALLWLVVLKKFPLSVAYPALSLSYVIIVFLAAVFFHEPLTTKKLIGVVFILSGVSFLFL